MTSQKGIGLLFLCLSFAHCAPQQSHVDARSDPCAHQEDGRDQSIQRWPGGILPYELSESLSAEVKVQLMYSMHQLENSSSCVVFVPRTEQQDYVRFEPGERCCSFIGKAGDGMQPVYISDACVQDHSVYDVMQSLIGLLKNISNTSADARHSNTVQSGEVVSRVTTEPTCSEMCGGFIDLNPANNTPGLVLSPQYPRSYPANAECVWKLTSPPGYAIRVEFREFDVEPDKNCKYDFVDSFQLNAKGETLRHRQWCGSQIPPLIRTEADSETVVIRFHSDESDMRKGFLFSYELEERRNYCYMDNGGCEHVCVPNDNGLRSTCACKEGYTLATDGYSCADINECSQKTDCDQKCTNTEGSFQCYCRPGFSLSSDQKTCKQCRVYYNSTSDIIRSTGYPTPYPSYQNCLWTIQVRLNHYLKIRITDFDIPRSAKCTENYLKLQHGHFPHHKKLCGYHSDITYVVDVGRSTDIRFSTKNNTSHYYSGFMLSYTQVPVEEVTSDDLKYVAVDGRTVPYHKRLWLLPVL